MQRECFMMVVTCAISCLFIGHCVGREYAVYDVCRKINFNDLRVLESESFNYFRRLCRESILIGLDRSEAEKTNKQRNIENTQG